MSTSITAPSEVTPRDLIASVRAARATADAAEVDVLRLAVEWAHAHPEVPGEDTWHAARATAFHDGAPDPAKLSGEQLEWFGIPPVHWAAPAAFAAANAMSTQAGRALIRDALVLRHRLPRLQARVVDGRIPVWRARRVAQAVLCKPRDVVALVDVEASVVIDRSGSIGPVVLARIVDGAMLRLYAEEREAVQLEDLDRRHVTLHESTLNDAGIAEMTLRGLWSDLKDLDDTVSEVAAALARRARADDDVVESLDVRRSVALGVLADPAAALALLADDPAWADRSTRREARVVVHVSDLALLGLDALAHAGTGPGTPILDQAVRDWCGRPGTRITVRPVIDLHHDLTREGHRPSDLQHEHVALRDVTCVFPWCARAAERCDTDHIVPPDPGEPPGTPARGPTDTRNLAALCRHHHRLKTHAGWRYTMVEPGVYLWSDPHGQQLLRTRDGTRDVAPAPTVGPGRADRL